ncbi:MAG: hypothetical protein PHF79_02555 [Candidatus Pacebacteria bacterium]|nr:hypothetical protein [Candidatus Paceibacterota bacterium]
MENQDPSQTSTPAPIPASPQASTPESKTGSSHTTVMGVLSYLGILVVIPLIVSRHDPFVKFHIKQGLVLLVIDIILWIVVQLFWILAPIVGLINLGIFVLVVLGIINVVQKKEKELPIVGSFAKHFKI